MQDTDLETVGATEEVPPFDREDVERALDALSPEHREVLVLRFFEDQSEAQTAQALGCSAGTVKSHTSRALARLRTLLDDEPVMRGTP